MTRTTRWACGLVVLAALASAAGASVAFARPVALSESARLHLTSRQGFTLNEQGRATGTIVGAIFIHLRLVSSNRVKAEVSIYPHGSSLTGYASASYRNNGSYASFSGGMSVARGSGGYAHTHASGLRFTGTIQRRNDAVTVQLTGSLYV